MKSTALVLILMLTFTVKAAAECEKGNCTDGEGTYVWSDGAQYSGQWRGDRQDGTGTMIWPNRDKYEGEWREGKRHGRGRYINKTAVDSRGIGRTACRTASAP